MLFLLLAASEGHVRLNYIDGSDMPIRNAGTATGNGRASVQGGLVWSKHELCCRVAQAAFGRTALAKPEITY